MLPVCININRNKPLFILNAEHETNFRSFFQNLLQKLHVGLYSFPHQRRIAAKYLRPDTKRIPILHSHFHIKNMKRLLSILFFCLGVNHYPLAAGTNEQPEITSAELERQIHQQINRERQNHGLPLLDTDELLTAVARKHSLDMANRHYFNHINLQGEGPVERAKNLGWNKKKQNDANTWAIGPGENIFLNHLYGKVVTTKRNGVTIDKQYTWKSSREIAQSTVQGWMDSPPHRKNILSPKYDQQGIGVSISGNDIYVTENMF